ncbi:integrase [Thiosulfatimonas sediminis]|uniref:Integrase n=1 Tax=Thiosulfatimonas sediminis TaxID=2675054 RepID=A0A6F8PSU8_9GAMM|nr:site-specific integrase [Thiosulfatimonas sediminis]BBP45107.1 integrase [Thiosulfatimonas sediminis]
MPKVLLTQKFISSATCPPDKTKIDYFDERVIGLLFKVQPSGRASWSLRYLNQHGQRKETRFADGRTVCVSDARDMAKEYLSELEKGNDPFQTKKDKKRIPTFAAFIAQLYLPHIKSRKRSWKTDVSLLKNHLLPALGKKRLDEITKRDLISIFTQHRETHAPGSTNRIIILVRYIFNLAIKWEIPIEKNPTTGIDLYPVNNAKERYLTKEEATRLFEALETSRSIMLKYIVSALLLTGARKNEVLKAKWEDFDFDQRIWTIEFNKSGKTRHVPMTDGLMDLLAQVPRYEGCDWVFPNPDTKKPYQHIFYAWDVVRKRAGMPELRIHDLRHSFASFLVNGGRSLYEVQKILGHTQVKTTQRYAHLSQDSLRSAADTATNMVPLVNRMPNNVNDVTLIEGDVKAK